MAERDSQDVLAEAIRTRARARNEPLLVAVDGRSGVGKSSISCALAEKLELVLVDGDDFYAGGTFEEWSRRAAKEKADRCIDWQRLRAEALEPLLAGRIARWRTFDWETMVGLSENVLTQKPHRIIVLDGVYSARPELADLIGLSVLLRLPDAIRRERLRRREGEYFVSRWHSVWDEAEDYYFDHVRPAESFDLVIDMPAK